jgi:hypothetical protein
VFVWQVGRELRCIRDAATECSLRVHVILHEPDCLSLTAGSRGTAVAGLQSVFRVERAPHNSQQRVQDYASRAAHHGAVDGATRCLPHLLDIRSFPTAEACIHSLKTTGCAVWALVRLRLPPPVVSRATQSSA